MPTSLAEQLKKLQAPQTSLLLQDKKRASLLFDPKEAANYDRQTIYELGFAGLEELKTLNARFSEFESTLFDFSAQSFERAVQTKDVNKKLDNNIRKFFFLLSPYFLLKPTHKALEWLINRFHIHQYNVDDLLMLALPYHESKIFVRIVQLIDLSDASNKWHWLQPLQKPGIPLSKSTLFNHAASSPYFLKLLSSTVINAVKEHRQYAGVLSSLLGFCCTTLLGILNRMKKGVSEAHMVHMLELIIHGLRSPVLDFCAASYMVVGNLVTTTSLSQSVLHQMVNCISRKQHLELKAEKALLLVLIYQRQHLKEIPFRALSRLVAQMEIPAALGLLAAKGVDTITFVAVVIGEALRIVQTQVVGDTSDMCNFVESILREVHFTNSGAEILIRTFIESFDVSTLEKGGEKPLVLVGDWNTPEDVMTWFAKCLQQLERSYPSVFDEAVCKAIKKTSMSTSKAASLRQMLGFELQIDLFEKLHHSKSKFRAEALVRLSNNCSNLKEKDELALRETLLRTLATDTAVVVSAALSFPVPVLCRILKRDDLSQALIKILLVHSATSGSGNKWTAIIPSVISILANLEKGSDKEEIETLLSILPHMTTDPMCAEIVLSSKFASRNKFLKVVKKGASQKTLSAVHKALCSSLQTSAGNIPLEPLLDIGEQLLLKDLNSEGIHESKFFYLLLLGSSLPNNAAVETSLESLQLANKILKHHKVSVCSEMCQISPSTLQNCLEKTFSDQIPLECFIFFLRNIISKTKLKRSVDSLSWIDIQTQSQDVMLLVQLFNLLVCGSATEKGDSQYAYVSALKTFCETYFPTQQKQIEFLANTWATHLVTSEVDGIQALRAQLRSLRLASVLISKQKDLEWMLETTSKNILIPALLLALTCPAAAIRKGALDIIKTLVSKSNGVGPYAILLEQIIESEKEIENDEEQLQLVLYTFLSPEDDVQSLLNPKSSEASHVVLNTLLECILRESTPYYVKASLLSSLSSVNDMDILEKLFPLVNPLLTPENVSLDLHCSAVLRNVFCRINTQTIGIFHKEVVWTVLEKAFSNHHTTVLHHENHVSCPAVLACEQVTRELWESIPHPQSSHHQRLVSLLIQTGTETESPSVVSAVAHCIKQLSLDATLIVNELTKMKDANVIPASGHLRRRSLAAAPSPQILETKAWRCGLTLLELLQNKKKLQNVHVLLPVLFELLKKCLQFEEQAPVEYAKQLLLSFILHCCQKISPEGTPVPTNILPTDILDVEAVVHCVRGTQNPQTHHHALLLLAHMAAMVPEQVLFNIMAIFTFMGTVVLRQDDAYSFQIISKVVDTIIPILIKANHLGTLSEHHSSQLEATVASVMRVFVDALLDVPEHRRLSLFSKLLSTLDSRHYLWLFLCLVIESHTVHHSEGSGEVKRSRATETDLEAPKRLEVALQIATQFSPDIILKNCVCLVQYLRSLPIDKILDERQRRGKQSIKPVVNLDRYRVKTLFDVDHHTPKQLRHYKYSIVTFLSTLLSSVPFVNKVTSLDENSTFELEPIYRELIEDLLDFIQVALRQYDLFIDTPSSKYWRIMVAHLYDILDKINALLPSHLFLAVVGGLMKHDFPSLRRKAMELLNSRLSSSQRDAFMESCDSKDLLTLLEPLLDVLSTISDERMDLDGVEKGNDELLLNQQTALLTIKYLSRQLAFDNYTKFKPLLEYMTGLIRGEHSLKPNLLASVVLCSAELCSSLRAHAISVLPILMPALIRLLTTQTSGAGQGAQDMVQVSLAAAMYRVVESLAAFLSPYLHPLLCAISTVSASLAEEEEDKVAHIAAKLKGTRQKLASAIPLRVLLPAVEKAYGELVNSNNLSAVGPLMSVLADSFAGLASSEITAMHAALTDFFLSSLELRSSSASENISAEQIDEVESHVVKALVALVLRMSESSFRPLYFRLFEWAVRHDLKKERTITFYRLSCGIAECLKGLFVLFAGHFLKNAAELLDHCNITKIGAVETDEPTGLEPGKKRHEVLFFGSGKDSETKCALLVNHILKTLHNVFLYDSQNFLSRERFEALMQPVVDQLENALGSVEDLRKRATDVLIPCISQLAAACTDDTLWKQLNYQLLIKTRHQTPTVRLISLEAVTSMATKLGESFLPMLPETVPFLAELLEDEEEEIETACRRAVQDLEQVLGEPIQKYF